MAELATLARPYANAVFDVANTDAESRQAWSRRLALLTAAVEDEGFRGRLMNPALAAEQRATLLADLAGDDLNEQSRNLIQVLAQNDRLELIPEIRERFELLKAEAEKTVEVQIISAFELSDEQRGVIDAALSKRFSEGVNVTTRIDESLVGGAIIRAGDMVIDGTVQGRLAKLRESLLRA